MLKTVIRSSFTNQGQVCLCSSRILVENSIFTKFKTEFCDAVSKLNISDPKDDETQFGAISSGSQFEKIKHYIEIAKNENGNILIGGQAIKLQGRCEKGWFIEPTVIEGLDNKSRVNQEEIFGPVVTLQSFQSEKEAIELANATKYGLSATIWTESQEKSSRVANCIDAGVVWINSWMVRDLRTPFGGMKNSGLGREGGDYALRFFTEQKNICNPK
jgi:aminomuconate-semialdehyde/2-hydroxymuconate-6-semialdehyde dehydrogenase